MHNPPRTLRSGAPILAVTALLGSLSLQPAAAVETPGWQPFGPGGGTVASLAIDPKSPATLYALVARADLYSDNAIFKSTDGAGSWARLWKGLPVYPEAFYPQALAIDPLHPSNVYTALCLRSAGHVFRNSDGEHWVRRTPQPGLDNTGTGFTAQSCLLAVAPGKKGALYFAMGTRLLRSADGGVRWQVVLNAPTEILSLFVDPAKPSVLYAGTAEGGGLWRSTASGSSFAPAPGAPSQVQALAANRALASHFVYAADGGAIYSSRNLGSTWTLQGDAGFPVSSLAVDARSPKVLYAAHDHGVSVSRNGGATWTLTSRGLPNVRRLGSDPPFSVVKVFALAAHPGKPGLVYAGTELAGVYQSKSGGQQWQAGDQRGLNGNTIYHLLFDPLHAKTICAYENLLGTLWCSPNGGKTWTRKSTTLSRGFTIAEITFDPSTPNTLVAVDFDAGDIIVYRSVDGGATWTDISHFDPQQYNVADVAVVDQGVLLLATLQGVLRSTDEGQSWTNVETAGALKLERDAGDPATVYLVEPAQGGGSVLRSRDAGLTWTPILGTASWIEADPALPETLYAFTTGTAQPIETAIQRSQNAGSLWTAAGSITGDSATSLVADRTSPDTLYLGTSNSGVLRSTDGGASWAQTPELPKLGYYGDYWVFADPATPHRFYAMPLEGGGLFVAEIPAG